MQTNSTNRTAGHLQGQQVPEYHIKTNIPTYQHKNPLCIHFFSRVTFQQFFFAFPSIPAENNKTIFTNFPQFFLFMQFFLLLLFPWSIAIEVLFCPSQSIHTLVDMFQYNRTVGWILTHTHTKKGFFSYFYFNVLIKHTCLCFIMLFSSYVFCLHIQLPELCTLVAFCNVFNCDDIQLKDSEQWWNEKESEKKDTHISWL